MIWATIVWAAAAGFLAYVASSPTGRRQIGAAAALIVGWVLEALFAVAPTVAETFAEGLITTFERNRDLWARVVSIFVREITGTEMNPDDLGRALSTGGLAGAAPKLGGPLIKAVQGVFAADGPLDGDAGQKNLEGLLGITFALSLQGWYTQAAGDLVSLGKFGAAADLPDTIERGLGLSRLGRLAWRAPIKKAIEEPLTIALNRRYQGTRLSLGEATKAWHAGHIEDDAFLDAAADAGYTPARAQVLLHLAEAQFTLAEIHALVKRQGLEHDTAIALLRRQGWGPNQAEQHLALMEAEDEQKYLDEAAGTARKLFRAGQLAEDEYRTVLGEAHLTDKEIGFALAADHLALRDAHQLSVSELGDLVALGHLTPEDYRNRLRRQHYDDADIDLLLALKVKRLSPAQVIDAFTRGTMTEEAATARLEGFGYSATDAGVLLSLHGKRLSEGQVMDALRHKKITAEQARADLQQLGYGADQVDLLLSFQAKTLSPADVQAAVLRGILSEGEALDRLTQAGYSPKDAQTILDLRVRLLTVGQIIDAYAAGEISRTTALQDLQARGLTAANAATIVEIHDDKAEAAAQTKAQKAATAQAQALARQQAAAIKAGTPPQASGGP